MNRDPIYLTKEELDKIKDIQVRMKQTRSNEERKRLVTKKTILLERARLRNNPVESHS